MARGQWRGLGAEGINATGVVAALGSSEKHFLLALELLLVLAVLPGLLHLLAFTLGELFQLLL